MPRYSAGLDSARLSADTPVISSAGLRSVAGRDGGLEATGGARCRRDSIAVLALAWCARSIACGERVRRQATLCLQPSASRAGGVVQATSPSPFDAQLARSTTTRVLGNITVKSERPAPVRASPGCYSTVRGTDHREQVLRRGEPTRSPGGVSIAIVVGGELGDRRTAPAASTARAGPQVPVAGRTMLIGGNVKCANNADRLRVRLRRRRQATSTARGTSAARSSRTQLRWSTSLIKNEQRRRSEASSTMLFVGNLTC